ncbi:MAG: lipase family protein [Panacagrimonas sp.]
MKNFHLLGAFLLSGGALLSACGGGGAGGGFGGGGTPPQGEPFPQPETPYRTFVGDPFYQAPAPDVLHNTPPGGVIRFREINARAVPLLPVRGQAWQVMYRSNDTNGQADAKVTTLLVPPRAPDTSRVLLSYQIAYDGLTLECAPSVEYLKGAVLEQALISLALVRGWVVSVPDYEGLDSQFTAAVNSGQGVLDGVRAALNFAQADLDGMLTPVGMMGYSGGALASAWASELRAGYAPELNVQGVAAGGVPVDLGNLYRSVDGSKFVGIYFTSIAGLKRAFPQLDTQTLFNADGQQMLRDVGESCVSQALSGAPDAIKLYAFQSISRYVSVPELLDVPAVMQLIAENRLGQGRPTAPTYLYHGTIDEVIPIVDVDELAQTYCDAGVPVQYRRTLSKHEPLAFNGAAAAVAYLADRFDGQPAPSNCGELRE